MIRFLLILLLLSFRAMAASTNIPVDITVTHPNPGGVITTSTWTNYSGATMPAGTPVHFAQAWRYDDIRQGSFPAVQDAATHTALVYQWDSIATAHENGGDSSWKHSVGIAKLAAPLANGASVTFEFPLVSGTYSQSQAVPLSNLCSGANAHALKIHLTDVRNQDDSVRKTGDATFDLCANINNTGRDAPRIVGSGSIRTEAQIMGQFVYTDSSKDPLLYALCDVGLYATGETEWVCHVMSPWMNVAAGSVGNSGAPGPAGFANDPQIISYRAAVQDGATTVLDYTNFDATLQSPNSPVISCPDNYGGGAGACLNVPSSTGVNSWYWPQTVRVTSCTGTCVGGLTQGQLAWVYPSGIAAARAFTNTTSINLLASPVLYGPASGTSLLTTSQGTGSTTFQHRIWHVKWASWETMDSTADENWSLPGGTTRTTRRFYPHLASAEQTYWEQTGIVPPVLLSQTIANNIDFGQTASPPFYAPLARMNVIGLGGPGFRHDIGLITDFASAAFVTQAQQDWYLARLYTMGTPFHGWMGVLNEVTGRIPPMNNGPPGTGGFGTGASYSQLGTPFPSLRFPQTTGANMAQPLQNVPNANFDWAGGMWGLNGTGVDHTPAFGSLTYIMWGEQQHLEMLRWNANHDIFQSPTYAIEPQNLNYAVRDTQVTPGPGQGHAFYCNVLYQNQNRGSAWTLRDITLPAALGSDGDQERVYYNDCITEMANSYPAINTFIDGSAQGTPLESSLTPPNFGGSGGTWDAIDVFIGDYMFLATYQMQTFLHSPMAAAWIPKFTRWYQGLLGGGSVSGSLDPFYGIDFSASPAVRNGDCVMNGSVTGGDVGKCLNPTDASDYGGFGHYTTFTAGSGQLQQRLNAPTYTLQVGDTIKYQGVMSYSTFSEAIDQLPGNQWFKVLGPIDNNNGTYFVENPATPGTPFSQFTRNGGTFSELNGAVIYRPAFVPPPTTQAFFNTGYCVYARQTLAGLTILGQDVKTPFSNFTFRVGGDINNCVSNAVVALDQTIVVPGSSSQPGPTPPSPPAPAVLAGFTTLAMNSDWTAQMPLGWLGGCPNGANLAPPLTAGQDNTGHTWWINLWWFFPDPYGVCNIGQITDPNFGGLTLDIPWTLNNSNPDGSGNFNWTRGNAMQTASRDFDNVNFNPPRGQANTFPINAYYEVVMRMTPQVPASFGAFNTWTPEGISTQAQAGIETDVAEWDSGSLPGSDAAVHNWQTGPLTFGVWGAGAPDLPSGICDPTQYCTFGMLTTSDLTDMYFCAYVNNRLINGCQSMNALGGGLTALEKTQRQFLILQNFCDSWNYDQTIPCGGHREGTTQHQYVRTARVWTCPTWASTQCLRSLITNPTASISSIRLANNSTTTGLPTGSSVGTLSVTMNPTTVTFSYSGTNLHLSTSGSDSGGVCNTTNGAGNSSFQVINGDTLATNGSPTAGNKAICVAAAQTGVSPAGQAFTIAVGNRIDAASGVGTAGCTGNGSSGSPWNYLCIQNAVNKAVSGDTVVLRGGNWTLNTGDATYVTINKQINLTGVGSGNTFDSFGHITNLEYTDQCPTSGAVITCINQIGTAYGPNDTTLQGGSTPSAGLLFFGSTSGQSSTCANVTVSHIFFDGSHTTDGGNNAALVSGMNCLGPITFNDIRLLTWTGANGNAETQFQMTAINTPVAGYPSTCPAAGTQGVNIYNSFFGEPNNTAFTNVNQDQLNYVETVNNSVFWQFVANPIDIDCFTFTGNTTVNTASNWEAEFGVTGFLLLAPGANQAPSNPVNNGGNGFLGNFHYFVRNNYFNSAGEALGVGSGVNDANTNGAVSDFHHTGNWIVATTGSLDSCSWRPRIPTEDCSGAMVINAQPSSSCALSSNGYPFEITNNSIIASASAQLNALAGSGNQIRCYQTGQAFPNGTLTQIKVFGYNATKNYLNSPSNKYNTDAFSVSPVATGNFCVGSTFTQSDSTTCATTGFTTLPTVSFTAGSLNSGVLPISSPTFTAQYGAVKWIASTSSTNPTSGDARWSFTPPVSLSSVAHGNTVYLWVMDSANNISSPASAVVP